MVDKTKEKLLQGPAAPLDELSVESVKVRIYSRLVRQSRNEVARVLLQKLDVQPNEVIEPSVHYDLTRRVLLQVCLRSKSAAGSGHRPLSCTLPHLTSHLVDHIGLIAVATLGWLGHRNVETNP